MEHLIIKILFYITGHESPIAVEDLSVKQLKQLRFRLLVEAGKIKQRIFDLTGEELD